MKFEWKSDCRRILLVVIGSFLMAVNINTFIHAAELYPGGASGLSLLLQKVFGDFAGIQLPYTLFNVLLNAAPAYVGFRYIGKKFTLLSCLVIALSSLMTDLLPRISITSEPMLSCVFGGLLGAFAVSLCLHADATSGGTDFIAMYVSQKYERDAFHYILVGNVAMLGVAGALFGWEKALYSIIYQFTYTQALHTLYKRYQKHTLFIITQKPEEIYSAIAQSTHHGATLFRGMGLYEQKERTMVYSVVSSEEIRPVLSKVKSIDEHAFINVLKTDQFQGRFYHKPTD